MMEETRVAMLDVSSETTSFRNQTVKDVASLHRSCRYIAGGEFKRTHMWMYRVGCGARPSDSSTTYMIQLSSVKKRTDRAEHKEKSGMVRMLNNNGHNKAKCIMVKDNHENDIPAFLLNEPMWVREIKKTITHSLMIAQNPI